MLDIIASYSSLGLSHIEGIDTMFSRFQLAVANIRKKSYDLLDQRKTDFDGDFEEFKRQTLEIRVSAEFALAVSPSHSLKSYIAIQDQLQLLLDDRFAKMPTTEQALQLTLRFKRWVQPMYR